MKTPQYIDLSGKKHDTTWDEIFAATIRIKAFFAALSSLFVQRDPLISAIMHAMLMREHVMTYGGPGTAKTGVLTKLAKNIDGATIWSRSMTRFTTETQVFGDYDLKELQVTGQYRHMIDKTMLSANLVNLGEFFDSNEALLRALLGVLHERTHVRGPQVVEVPLITALADTNFSPLAYTMPDHPLEAVVDRFLFWVNVKYVEGASDRLRMLTEYLDRKQDTQLPPLSLQDIILVSGAVVGMNLLGDRYVQEAYEELTREFRSRIKWRLSDRTWLKAAQIMEVSALLRGATTVEFQDMKAVRYILVRHPDDGPIFDEIVAKILSKWEAEDHRRQVQTEMDLLNELEAQVPSDQEMQDATGLDLLTMIRRVRGLQEQITKLQVNSPSASDKRADLIARLEVAGPMILYKIQTPTAQGGGSTPPPIPPAGGGKP